MAGTAEGVLRTAAARVGVSAEEYAARRGAGEKWCHGCRAWHSLAVFSLDRSRGDGRKATCRDFDRARHDATYIPVPLEQRKPGGRPVPARDGDVRQARRSVNYLVEQGRIPAPNDMSCIDCAHVYEVGGRRHEYDHHLGYGAEYHLVVEAVCSTCHHARERVRAA